MSSASRFGRPKTRCPTPRERPVHRRRCPAAGGKSARRDDGAGRKGRRPASIKAPTATIVSRRFLRSAHQPEAHPTRTHGSIPRRGSVKPKYNPKTCMNTDRHGEEWERALTPMVVSARNTFSILPVARCRNATARRAATRYSRTSEPQGRKQSRSPARRHAAERPSDAAWVTRR